MNPGPTIRRLIRILAGLASALLALAAAPPAALASGPGPLPPGWNKHLPLPAAPQPVLRFPPGWNKHPPLPGPAHLHALAGGMPGWEITLIAAGAVLLTTAVAVTYRLRAARRRVSATAA